jgi:hypothetical protein
VPEEGAAGVVGVAKWRKSLSGRGLLLRRWRDGGRGCLVQRTGGGGFVEGAVAWELVLGAEHEYG